MGSSSVGTATMLAKERPGSLSISGSTQVMEKQLERDHEVQVHVILMVRNKVDEGLSGTNSIFYKAVS